MYSRKAAEIINSLHQLSHLAIQVIDEEQNRPPSKTENTEEFSG